VTDTLQKERIARARAHVAYVYLLNECLIFDEEVGLHRCPSRVEKLIVMHEMEKVFDYDIRGVPGFFLDLSLYEGRGAWSVNTPEAGYVKPVTDARGRVASLHVLKQPRDHRPKILSSKGLPLGS
jgi:hypothetical protein